MNLKSARIKQTEKLENEFRLSTNNSHQRDPENPKIITQMSKTSEFGGQIQKKSDNPNSTKSNGFHKQISQEKYAPHTEKISRKSKASKI